jgi:hypothetical protein
VRAYGIREEINSSCKGHEGAGEALCKDLSEDVSEDLSERGTGKGGHEEEAGQKRRQGDQEDADQGCRRHQGGTGQGRFDQGSQEAWQKEAPSQDRCPGF